MDKFVENFGWVDGAFTKARLRPYLEAAQGNLTAALDIYSLNIRVGNEIFNWISVAEVVLRNALAQKIIADKSSVYFEPLFIIWADLSADGKASYKKAEGRLRQIGVPITPNSITAELPFSFWRHLLSARYESTFWTPLLRHAFPHMNNHRRATVFEAVASIGELRNRIAHHEPIFGRQLGSDLAQIQQIIGWISPEALAWAKANLPAELIGVSDSK